MAIGEIVLGAVLQVVFDRLASQQVISFFKSSKLDESLVKKLTDLMGVAEKLLADAERKQNFDAAVKSWLDELKHLFYRAEEIVDEIATEAKSPEHKSFRSKLWNSIPGSSSFASTINSQMNEVVTRLEFMLTLSHSLNLKEGSVDVNTPSRWVTTSYFQQDDKVFGRDREKEELLKFLFSEEAEKNRIGVVAIVGMGGMGKTTLAKLVYNDESLGAFDPKAWVYVSDHFNVSRVIISILQSITGKSYSGSVQLDVLHRELIEKLREKMFFLVLDDVWNKDIAQWESLLTPLSFGAHGSKIIVTTRNEEVASIMQAVHVIHLKPLSDADGWSIFSKHAFEVGNSSSDPRIELLGRQIVDKCQGLPLAIKTLGGLLWSKKEINEWEVVLHSSLWDLPAEKCNVAPALMLCYYHLPSHLKRCFSYCAIFPKGYRFDRKKLVLMWMAEDFVKPSGGQRTEDIGEDYLNKLLSCSFFDRSTSGVVMHDLMHDLAEAVSGNFFSRLEHEDQALKISEKARYFSFSCNPSRFEGLHEAKYLRAFVSLRGLQIRFAMVPQLHCLHTLSLTCYDVIELPDSIGNLKQLRYLYVSNVRIKELPESVSTLCNLQSLLLSDCRFLERLPSDTSRLVSLRHLDLCYTTSLRQMPNYMSKLKCLQTLCFFIVGKHCGQGIEELRDLREIRGKLALRRLQNISSPDCALDANLSCKEFINELALEYDDSGDYGSQTIKAVLDNLKPHPNLEKLTIRDYPGTQFPIWLDTQCSMYKNMVKLILEDCKNCHRLPQVGQLPSLKYLEIVGMEFVDKIGPEFYGYDSGITFPVLKDLVFENMENWEEWWGHEMEGILAFQCLEKLKLSKCPKLKGYLPGNVGSLKVLDIRDCDSLSLENSLLQQLSVEGSASLHRALGISFHFASLTKLELKGMKELVSLPPEVGMLSCLDALRLEECEKLKFLRNVRLPTKLGRLEIRKCNILESLPTELNLLNNLRVLRLSDCPSVKSGPEDSLPTSLQDVWVHSCESWEFTMAIELERMQCYSALQDLFINKVGGGLVSFPLGGFPNLQRLTLVNLRDLERVNIPTGADLVNLTYLQIGGCRKLKWVGKTEEEGVVDLPAPNLQHLQIRGCEMVKPLLRGDRQGLPSKLQSLWIDTDYYPNTDTVVRNLLMFSSLRELHLWDHQGEEFPDKGCCSLPVSITSLGLNDFRNLKRLNGEALKTLTSLQQLFISNCPNLECLPEEGLPPSLRELHIQRCPKLKERCKRDTGLDWPKISHIPNVHLGRTF